MWTHAACLHNSVHGLRNVRWRCDWRYVFVLNVGHGKLPSGRSLSLHSVETRRNRDERAFCVLPFDFPEVASQHDGACWRASCRVL
jgi:hypothetical protein